MFSEGVEPDFYSTGPLLKNPNVLMIPAFLKEFRDFLLKDQRLDRPGDGFSFSEVTQVGEQQSPSFVHPRFPALLVR